MLLELYRVCLDLLCGKELSLTIDQTIYRCHTDRSKMRNWLPYFFFIALPFLRMQLNSCFIDFGMNMRRMRTGNCIINPLNELINRFFSFISC